MHIHSVEIAFKVRLLLHAGADFEQALETDGSTPLLIAAAQGHADVVAVLLERGAERDRAKRNGQTPILAAKQQGHEAVVRILEAAGAGRGNTDVAQVFAYNH